MMMVAKTRRNIQVDLMLVICNTFAVPPLNELLLHTKGIKGDGK